MLIIILGSWVAWHLLKLAPTVDAGDSIYVELAYVLLELLIHILRVPLLQELVINPLEILVCHLVKRMVAAVVHLDLVLKILNSFVVPVRKIPLMLSRKLGHLARLIIDPQPVVVYWLHLLERELPRLVLQCVLAQHVKMPGRWLSGVLL